jgi:hypothetical protein
MSAEGITPALSQEFVASLESHPPEPEAVPEPALTDQGTREERIEALARKNWMYLPQYRHMLPGIHTVTEVKVSRFPTMTVTPGKEYPVRDDEPPVRRR